MLPLAKLPVVNPALDLATVVWCIYIGAVLGWAGVLYNKMIPGLPVRRLLKKQVFSPDSALSLSDLSLDNFIYRFLLRDGSTLRRIISSEPAQEVPDGAKRRKKRDVSRLRFYIPEELKYRAEIRYSFKISELVWLVIGAILLLAAAVILYNYGIPFIMDLLTSIF